jgi:pyrroline-5-carboxylate reductase
MSWSHQRLAFMGTGQMATSLASGLVRSLLKPEQISGYDPLPAARERFAAACGAGARITAAPAAALDSATLIVLAVKPQVMAAALNDVRAALPPQALVVSVAAGITLQTLSAALPEGTRIVRVMPNTPCLIGRGASGLAPGASATADDINRVTELLQTVGIVEVVSESLLDAVTGLSGSGPAYVFQFLEALADGGVRMGLPRATALRLAAQTLAGAADMQLQSGQHPAVLKDSVASPGGTTIAGLHALETGAFRAAVMDAVVAATRRSQELGNPG